MAIREKTVIEMAMDGKGRSPARTDVSVRDVTGIVDEPEARGGTNQGLTPTETLMAALIGCTNVISHRIAQGMGVELGAMDITLKAEFDRRGVTLAEEVDVPFDNIVMDIDVTTDATPDQLDKIKSDLARFCPIAKVIRGSGAQITEHWNARPL